MSGNVRKDSTAAERNCQVKTKEGDTQSAYLEDKLVGSTYVTFTEEDGTYGKRLKCEVDASAIGAGVLDWKVKVDSSDSEDYLENKIDAGTGIDVTSTGSAMQVSLDADIDDLNDVTVTSAANLDLLRYNGTNWINDYGLENTHTGATDKVPTARSMSDVIQTLTVTDNDDLSSGNAIMYDKEDIDASRIMVIGKASTTFSSYYPAAADLVAAVADFRTESALAAATGWDRSVFGNVEIGSDENGAGTDNFVAALINFSLDEDYISAGTIYLDVMFKLAQTGAADQETRVKAFPYNVQEDDAQGSALSTVEITDMVWDGSAQDTYVWKTFSITGPTADSRPTPIGIFLACQSANGSAPIGSGNTRIDNTSIVCARVRYLKKTVQLRTADVSM